jgi:hypothetical protein
MCGSCRDEGEVDVVFVMVIKRTVLMSMMRSTILRVY